jgi:hypothetical protein
MQPADVVGTAGLVQATIASRTLAKLATPLGRILAPAGMKPEQISVAGRDS